VHGPLTLKLQAQRAVEFQRRREEHRGGDCLAERVADFSGIVAMLQQRAPRRVEMHQVAPERVVLEQEPVKTIAIVHSSS
jgi:hypothetical protein